MNNHKCSKSVYLFSGLMLMGLLLSACTLSAAGSPTADTSAIFTQAAQTLEAQITLAASGAFPTKTPLTTQGGTAIPVITPTSPGDPVVEPPDDGSIPCDRAKFVEDVSIPDGTQFLPDRPFTKTWKLKNNGSCTWTSDYTIVFDSGDAMGGPASFPLTGVNIPPGSDIEISVDLTAPEESGSYRGDWKLRNPAGQSFGLGTNADASFWVVINVSSPPTFSLGLDNFHNCNGTSYAIFRITNDGNGRFESAEITLTDLNNGTTLFGPLAHNGPFMSNPGECPQGGDSVQPGNAAYLGGGLGSSPPSGHTVRATIKICSQDELGGSCEQETTEFNIP